MATIKVVRFDAKENNPPLHNIQRIAYEEGDCYYKTLSSMAKPFWLG